MCTQDALARVKELCSQVNEGVREKENSDRLEWIQSRVHCEGLAEKITFNSPTNCLGPRKYLHSGVLQKVRIQIPPYGGLVQIPPYGGLVQIPPQWSFSNTFTVKLFRK